MKKLMSSFLMVTFVSTVLADASITETFVRQEWPWSSRVTVEYVIEGVTEPVDVSLSVSRKGIACEVPDLAVTGDRYGVATSGLNDSTSIP